MTYKFSKRSKERMKGVNWQLILLFEEAIKVSPIDFGIPGLGGTRTYVEQKALYDAGSSKCDGYARISRHQEAAALDFYAYINGKASWDKVHLTMVATTILITAARLKDQGDIDCDITWGATFGSRDYTGWDFPHIQIKA